MYGGENEINLDKYTIEYLREIKAKHENNIKELTNPNKESVKNFYKSTAIEWSNMACLNKWDNLADNLGAHEPYIIDNDRKTLTKLQDWLRSRAWPKAALDHLGKAFDNFRNVLDDLMHAMPHFMSPETHYDYNDTRFILTKPPSNIRLSEEDYNRQVQIFEDRASALQYLIRELTRAANYIVCLIRKEIDSLFRLQEGNLRPSDMKDTDTFYHEKHPYPYKLPEKYKKW